MRVPGSWSLLLAASFTSSFALAGPVAPAAPLAPAPEPPPPEPAPAPTPAVAPTDDAAAPASATEAAPSDAPATAPGLSGTPATSTRLAEARAESVSPVGASPAPAGVKPPSDFTRNYHALPLTLEARFGINLRLGSSFDDRTEEERLGAHYAFAAYLAWRPEFALGLELDHSGLGRVRALSGQNSLDNDYSTTGTWLGARVFPIRRERLDVFVNLRIGLVWQHVDAIGTRADSANITEPARSFSCTAWDGPGFGLGGALGLAYRFGRHVAFVSRIDLSAQHLSGESLDTCADGVGSVANLGGSIGLAFEFETAPK